MIIKEAIQGVVGKKIRDILLTLIAQLDHSTLEAVRSDTKSLAECRYRAGVADGVRFALKHVMDLGEEKSDA